MSWFRDSDDTQSLYCFAVIAVCKEKYQAGPEYSWAACVVLADTVSKLQCIMFYLTRIGQLVQTSQLSFSVWRPWLAAQSFTRLLTTNFKIRIIFEQHTHAAHTLQTYQCCPSCLTVPQNIHHFLSSFCLVYNCRIAFVGFNVRVDK